MFAQVPEIRTYFTAVAPGLERPNPVNFGIGFTPARALGRARRARRRQITAELGAEALRRAAGRVRLPGQPALARPELPQPAGAVRGAGEFLRGAGAHDATRCSPRRASRKAIANPDTDLRLNKPQLEVDIDRDKAAALGIDVETIGRTLETLLGGRQVTRFKREGKQYDVIVQLEAKDRNTPADLTSIFVRARDGTLVQLSNLVKVRETVAPKELNHFNRLRAADDLGQRRAGLHARRGARLPRRARRRRLLDASARVELDGPSREFRESGATLLLTFVLALAFIYLVLAAQFESFVSPFVIMLTVPLAMTGALLALKLTGGTLNVYSQIGLVMLIGLITKHGILIVEFANQLREQRHGARPRRWSRRRRCACGRS